MATQGAIANPGEQLETASQSAKKQKAIAGAPNVSVSAALLARAQGGDEAAVSSLLVQFRPLLRSRMYGIWTALQDQIGGAEWGDVESQVHLLFLTRLQSFRADEGVYFPHYMARLLELDCRAWVRRQRRHAAVPFSQLANDDANDCDLTDTWTGRSSSGAQRGVGESSIFTSLSQAANDSAPDIERAMSLRAALDRLTRAQREVVWDCCVMGRTEQEAAASLGISRSAVRNRLAGALARMRAFFEDNDAESTAASAPPGAAFGNPRSQRDDSDSMYAPARTRTGRATPDADCSHRFWIARINMTKDDRRPDLVGIGAGRPVFLQGVYDFPATGLKNPEILSPRLSYTVPKGRVLGIRFFRAGVSCERMVCLSTVINGDQHRLIPIAPNGAMHVPFAIVEPIIAGSQIEIHVASEAPGTAIIDVGFLEMPA